MPPQRAAHSEALDFADHPRDLMSPISEQEVITPTPTSYTKSTNLSQRAKRLMINLGRRAYVADETTSTTSNSTPVHTTSTLASSLVPHNFSCPQCLIPDNDPFVHYGGVWFLNVGPQSFTSHSTTTPGSSISLKFNGSGILIFGTVPASNDTVPPPSAVYFLDKNPPFPTTLPRAAMDIPHQPLFATQQHLSDEEHLIIINITKASAPYTLSGFFVFPNMDTKNMEVGQPTTKPFSNTTKSQTSQTPLSSNSSSAAMEQMSSSSGGHHQTSQKSVKILTAALAVIGFLLLVGSVIFFIFRRRTLARLRQVVRVSCPEAKKARPDTVYTSFTGTESILQNDPNFWAPVPSRSNRSNGSRSEGPGGSRNGVSDSLGRRSTIDFAPPPLPPKAIAAKRFSPLSSNPG